MSKQITTYGLILILLSLINVSYSQCNIDAGVDTVINCTNPSVTLNGSGGVLYSWSPSNGLDDPNIANPVASPTNTTTYTLTITGGNGCIETEDITVTVDDTTPTASAGSDETTDCIIQPTVNLNATGGVSYEWSPSSGLDDHTVGNPVANPNTTTTYTVTVTGANGCEDTDDVTITVDKDLPPVNAGSDETIDCNVLSVNLNATGGGSYSWSPTIGLNDPLVANPVATPTSTTQYTVSVTGANGCVATDDVTVTVDNQTPTVDAGVDGTIDDLHSTARLQRPMGITYCCLTIFS